MTSFGSWLPDVDSSYGRSVEGEERNNQRVKFFAAMAVWLTVALDAALAGIVWFESDMTAAGALCAAAALVAGSLLVVFVVLAIVWSLL